MEHSGFVRLLIAFLFLAIVVALSGCEKQEMQFYGDTEGYANQYNATYDVSIESEASYIWGYRTSDGTTGSGSDGTFSFEGSHEWLTVEVRVEQAADVVVSVLKDGNTIGMNAVSCNQTEDYFEFHFKL